MENQHRLIKGYRDFDKLTVERINYIKEAESALMGMLDREGDEALADPRWLAIARTDLEKGFMSFVRAVATGR